MKLLEKFIYSAISFLAIYVILSVALRVFSITTDYVSHMVGGITATVLSMAIFMYLLIKK